MIRKYYYFENVSYLYSFRHLLGLSKTVDYGGSKSLALKSIFQPQKSIIEAKKSN